MAYAPEWRSGLGFSGVSEWHLEGSIVVVHKGRFFVS
jgi:hypothetical protein